MTPEKCYIITESQLAGTQSESKVYRKMIMRNVHNQPVPDIAGVITMLENIESPLEQDERDIAYNEGIEKAIKLLRPLLKEVG